MKGLTVPIWQVVMREAHDYFMITIGLLCYAIGWILFLLPNDITTGGVAGVCFVGLFCFESCYRGTICLFWHQCYFAFTGSEDYGLPI